ncbi:outer membrane lipoprotein chaperone LolA [Dyella terrae]|uniref:outer membrane lipoprotein chaperone LolA n=1 Tax=Dyella terrae TaxID=522259 RepID=UPI001EFC47F9|nr:outer membrane lipoprotein chaperone LolA [Dyella terrae]ULU23911.1 outer membrane lipoprotein chaperone LolA [Dyella terrae]
MKRLLLLAAATVALSVSSFAMAAGPARSKLDAFTNGMHSLTGNFSQTLKDANGNAGKPSNGTLALEAPRQFRWETLAPSKQTIVADGSRVWLYDPDLEQVTVRVQSSEESHSPLTVLTDVKQMDKDFNAVEQGDHDGLNWLRLTSKAKDPQFDYADLGFDANGLARMVFRDQLGAVTDIRFSDWHRNVAISPETFNFVPPPGTDVIGDAPVIQTQPIKN